MSNIKKVYYVNHTKKEVGSVDIRFPSTETGILSRCWSCLLGIKDAFTNGMVTLNVSGWSHDDDIQPCKNAQPYIDQGYTMK